MNRKKILIVVLIIIVALSLISVSRRLSSVDNMKISSGLNGRNNLSFAIKSSHKTTANIHNKNSIQNELINTISTKEIVESQVPWEELHEKWLEELKGFLISISDKDGQRMFNEYLEARENYLKEDTRLGEKYQQIHSSKVFDRKKEDQLAVESAEVFDKATEVNKKIFGQYYPSVKKIHKEFEDSIQVYSRDMPISLDFGFGE